MKSNKEFYEEQGYLKINVPGIIPHIEQIQSNLVQIIYSVSSAIDLKGPDTSKMSDTEVINRFLPEIHKKNPKAFSFIYDSIRYHANLLKLFSCNDILEICNSLYPKNSNGYQSNISELQIVMQRPQDDVFINGIHQDSGFFSEYSSKDASMVVWINMFDCSKHHGTIEVIPGSHSNGRIAHDKNEWDQRRKASRNVKGSFFISETNLEAEALNKIIPVECIKGDVVFMHYDLVHRSGVNISDDMRITFLSRNTNLFGTNYIPKYGIW